LYHCCCLQKGYCRSRERERNKDRKRKEKRDRERERRVWNKMRKRWREEGGGK